MGGLDPAASSARATDGALSPAFAGSGKDRPLPLAVPRPRRRLPAPVREPEDRQVRLRARLRQRVGAGHLREAAHQVRRVCPHRRFLPVTDDVIRWHLSGPTTRAISRSSRASTRCSWTRPASSWPSTSTRPAGRQDAIALRARRVAASDLPAALERSRSGHGGHVWLFFEEAVPAALARRLGRTCSTETMEDRPDIGLDSYDRLLPESGHAAAGRLRQPDRAAAAEASRASRATASSSTTTSMPYPDQWAFLASVRRIGRAEVEADRSGGGATRPHPRRAAAAAGRRRRRAVDRRRRRAAARSRRSPANCPRAWSWSSATRSTSPRRACLPACGIDCSAWRRSRTRSSTRRRRCGCRPTTSRASSPAPRIIRSTSACRAAAWTTFAADAGEPRHSRRRSRRT